MKLIRTEDAVGQVLCHDMTQIVPEGEERFKGPRFRKGHVVAPEDIPVLLSMGKEHLYVWEMEPGMLHENDAAKRLAALCLGEGTVASGEPSEGKIGINAATDGVFLVDAERLFAVNSVDEVMVATRKGGFGVKAGDALAGTRVIPLVVEESTVEKAERAAGGHLLMSVKPYSILTAAIIATGSEVKKGLIEDRFTPVMEQKLADFGVTTTFTCHPGDDVDDIVEAIHEAEAQGAELILCTGGMSVDPDDNTPGAIKRAGARIVTYGAPVLPGAMLLVGYLEHGHEKRPVPILGVPGCAMYNAATVLDLVLPRIIAEVPLEKRDFVELGEGGLCLRCPTCTYPVCPFGK